jgi:cell shape-determining protein MreC
VKLFYGEFDETQPETFFSSLANFVVDFENARKDNEESRARSKKKKQNKLKQDQRAREMALKKKARKTQQIERRSNHHTISRRGSINVMKPPRAANTPPALKSTYFTL